MQGFILNNILIANYVAYCKYDLAADFIQKTTGKILTKKQIIQQNAKNKKKNAYSAAKYLIESQMYDWCDLINFHYYSFATGLPYIVDFLKQFTKPLMTNEIGVKDFSVDPGQELVDKCQVLHYNDVSPVIWFSVNGEEDNNVGALVDDNGKINIQMLEVFKHTQNEYFSS